MSKFFFISHDGAGLPLAYRLKQEGHHVSAWIEDPKVKHLYDGLLKKVDSYKQGLGNDPIVVFDSVGIGIHEEDRPESESEWNAYHPISQQIIKKGYRVVGSSKMADRMEFDRTWGAELASEAGLLIPESKKFESFSDAATYVEDTKSRYIMKPHGNQAVFSNYPAQGWEDMVAMLEHYEKTFPPVPILLQEFIGGQQMSIEGWWTGEEFVGINSTFEFKPQLHGDVGPLTGETGSVVFYYPKGKPSKMESEVLMKLVPVLRRIDYPTGPLDVNTIINEDGAHFLEFTARFGYPALYIQMSAVDDDWGTSLEKLVDGQFGGFTPKDAHWFMGARVWIPKWPYGETEKTLKDAPFFMKLKPKDMDHVHLVDAYFDGERLRAGGTDGELMCVTADGQTIAETQGKLFGLIKDFWLYPMGFRDDVGSGIKLELLQRLGYWLPADH